MSLEERLKAHLNTPTTNGDYDSVLHQLLIDWETFWAKDHNDAEWIAEPVIPAGRSVALFAPGGTGKSLLALWLSAHLTVGLDPFTKRRIDPIDVLYLDYEMTEDDLAERLEQMGFGPGTDLTRLHYALLPSLPGLDQPEGGKAVVRLAQLVNAQLVVVDTFGRAVHGDENDADTVRAWYRWTGLHLKHEGRAFIRVDHAGKDIAKGQRGSSAKNDDVDIVWQMTAKENNAFTLTAKKRRMGWVPLTVDIQLDDEDVLNFGLLADNTYPTGTVEMSNTLDELNIPVETSANAAARLLRAAGRGGRNQIIRAAQKYRRDRSLSHYFIGDETAPQTSGRASTTASSGAPSGAPPDQPANPQVIEVGRGAGRGGARPQPQLGRDAPPLKGAHLPSGPQPDPLEDF